MKFNFREALENLSEKHKYYETPEGYAEWFLRNAVEKMAHMGISSKEIGEIYFVLFQDYLEEHVSLMMAYVPKDKVQEQKFWEIKKEIPEIIHHAMIFSTLIEKFKDFLKNRREGILIFEAIENEINSQGFVCEDIAPLHKRRDQNLIKYIKIKI